MFFLGEGVLLKKDKLVQMSTSKPEVKSLEEP